MTSAPPVLVIGNCTVDHSFLLARFPLPGETLLADRKVIDLGGKGANQAVAAQRFGARTTLATAIGNDDDGTWALARLSGEGLDLANVLLTDGATDQSIIYLTPSGENSIVSTHDAAAQVSADWASGIVATAPPGSFVVMQGNLTLETTRAAFLAARARTFTTILNPAPIHYDFDTIYPFVDVLVVNQAEAKQLGKAHDAIAAAMALHDSYAIGTVIVTLGERGVIAFSGEGRIDVAAPRVDAIDSAGAGDVFCGALTTCLGYGASLKTAMLVAVEAASLAVTRRGTQTAFPSIQEARKMMMRHGVNQ